MAAVIEFPSGRIVRPLRKRVVRPRKQAKTDDPISQQTMRLAAMLLDCALSDGKQTLEQVAKRVYAAEFAPDDRLMLKMNVALKAELHKRMAASVVVPMC
ncbi:hypothetical protein HDC36_003410 [Xanthomonas sp. JAI131]|uniref:hypothetical protein n=1 Tax=Xanthomonas sp. JAI131 TaxID=2723067 RepID=UPI0015C743D1|nr:hypothetical protein [Xanthomonas sp. JAI131]NYF21934.1 hypothetical protein [Xanthomonas sp. JAI131]